MKHTFQLLLIALCVGSSLTSCRKNVVPDPAPPDTGPTWTQLKAPKDTITVLATFNHTIYAASDGNTLYRSTDNGAIWSSSPVGTDDVAITAMGSFHNRLFIGTDNNGIFSSTDGGITWTANGNLGTYTDNRGEMDSYPVSNFAIRSGKLYASSGGNGVYVLDETTNSWMPFNNNLPEIITSYDVFRMINIDTTLVIAAGVNGTFYYYDFKAGGWVETYLPKWGSYIKDMILDSGSLYAITTEQKIIRSDNHGINWYYDNEGFQSPWPPFSDSYQQLYTGTTKDYAISNVFKPGRGAWIQQRNRNAAIGSSWANDREFLKDLRVNAIVESDGNLFLGTNTGIYSKRIN